MNEKKKPETINEIDNSSLIAAMKKMKETKSKDAEKYFMVELKKALFITPALLPPGTEGNENQKHYIRFRVIKNYKGEMFIPAFTSGHEMKKWIKEEKIPSVIIHFEDYLNGILSDPQGANGLIIDPFGDNILLPRDLLATMKKTIDAQKNMLMIKDVNPIPADLEAGFIAIFQGMEAVKRAYFQLMKRGETISYLLVVDIDYPEGAPEEQKRFKSQLFGRIVEEIRPILKDRPLSVEDYVDIFVKNNIENKVPFYETNATTGSR